MYSKSISFGTVRGVAGEKAGQQDSCSYVINSDAAESGNVSSPSYPFVYPPNSLCRVHFLAHGRQRVQLKFIDFDLFQQNGCLNGDVVRIFESDDRSAPLDFCGGDLPPQIMSSDPTLTLEFRSADAIRRNVRGFTAKFRFVQDLGMSAGVRDPRYPCAFAFNATADLKGTIHSPNFPDSIEDSTEDTLLKTIREELLWSCQRKAQWRAQHNRAIRWAFHWAFRWAFHWAFQV
ncbi:unnamed protein product [Cyprideis torosa]|uniref:Uncharacterized protein n=1 Tax=Cyprideis torosa TaxID=163714 RepID=A0A7R8WLX4_9CRUS|nr:unnamed protein product [Cyprideis torosa]CAG0904721.1 unnamed protein product [Cyprideis torosa]